MTRTDWQSGPVLDRGDAAAEPRKVGALARALRLVGTVAALGLVGALAVACGFLWFVWRVPSEEITLNRKADGIVVLTGGASRIADAIELLATGHGRRLLISGVNRTTSSQEISRLVPDHRRVFDCCVDLDYSALNTSGNAVETRRWVKSRGFTSVIVVTSNYHMPRAMAELGHHLPDVALIPFPVVSERLRSEPWWSSDATAKLLFSEYVKYSLAKARLWLGADTEADPAHSVTPGAASAVLR